MHPRMSLTAPRKLLNPASGYLAGYSHTLNPYVGCTFACSYCYVREMPVAKFRKEPWGRFVDVKSTAAKLLSGELTRAKRKGLSRSSCRPVRTLINRSNSKPD